MELGDTHRDRGAVMSQTAGHRRAQAGPVVTSRVAGIRRRFRQHSTSASSRPARRTARSGGRSRRRDRGRAAAGTSRSTRRARRSGTAAGAPTPTPAAGTPRSPPVSAGTPGGSGSRADRWSRHGRLSPVRRVCPGSPVTTGRTSARSLVLAAARGLAGLRMWPGLPGAERGPRGRLHRAGLLTAGSPSSDPRSSTVG